MRISRILLTIFVFVGLVDVQGLSQAGAADKFVLGMPVRPPIMVHLPVFYALDKGFFKKNGLDVDVQFFRGGNATHRAITSANSKLDAAVAPAALAMVGITKGSGLKFFHSMGYKLEAQIAAAPGIDNVQKLRGKTFGIEAEAGTIRGDYGCSKSFNLLHGSDSSESATRELGM